MQKEANFAEAPWNQGLASESRLQPNRAASEKRNEPNLTDASWHLRLTRRRTYDSIVHETRDSHHESRRRWRGRPRRQRRPPGRCLLRGDGSGPPWRPPSRVPPPGSPDRRFKRRNETNPIPPKPLGIKALQGSPRSRLTVQRAKTQSEPNLAHPYGSTAQPLTVQPKTLQQTQSLPSSLGSGPCRGIRTPASARRAK